MWPFNKIRKMLADDRTHLRKIQAIILKISTMSLEEAKSRCEAALSDPRYYECLPTSEGSPRCGPEQVGASLGELFGRYSSIKSPWIDIGEHWIAAPQNNPNFIHFGQDQSQGAYVKRGTDLIFHDPAADDVPEPTFVSVYHMILADYFTSPYAMERDLSI